MKLVRTSIWLIAIFTLITLVLDLLAWNVVFHKGVESPAYYRLISQIGRFLRTVLVLAFIPEIFSQTNDQKSARLLAFAFLLTIIADFFLILREQLIVGIAFFALMQLLLIIRHLSGFRISRFRESRYGLSMTAGLTTWGIAMTFMRSGLEQSGLFLPVAIYGLLLIISVWAAYCAMFLEKMKPRLAKLAFWGMLRFLCCDITVGLGAIWPGTSAGTFVRAITGLFYAPCLIFLGISGLKNFRVLQRNTP